MKPTAAQLKHNWRLAQARLAFAKKEEMRWRMLCVLEFFPDPALGVNHAGNLTLTTRENITVENDANKIKAVFTKLEENGQLCDICSLLDFKPSLRKEAYEALSIEAKNILAEILTIKIGTPSLKLKGQSDVED